MSGEFRECRSKFAGLAGIEIGGVTCIGFRTVLAIRVVSSHPRGLASQHPEVRSRCAPSLRRSSLGTLDEKSILVIRTHVREAGCRRIISRRQYHDDGPRFPSDRPGTGRDVPGTGIMVTEP